MKVIVKVPASLAANLQALGTVVESALNDAAQKAQEDMQRTTATWRNKPTFAVTRQPGRRIIGTDDDRWFWITRGTRARIIRAKRRALAFAPGGRAKTSPGLVGSGSGARGGSVIFRRQVRHPGIAARQFEETIAARIGPELATILETAFRKHL